MVQRRGHQHPRITAGHHTAAHMTHSGTAAGGPTRPTEPPPGRPRNHTDTAARNAAPGLVNIAPKENDKADTPHPNAGGGKVRHPKTPAQNSTAGPRDRPRVPRPPQKSKNQRNTIGSRTGCLDSENPRPMAIALRGSRNRPNSTPRESGTPYSTTSVTFFTPGNAEQRPRINTQCTADPDPTSPRSKDQTEPHPPGRSGPVAEIIAANATGGTPRHAPEKQAGGRYSGPIAPRGRAEPSQREIGRPTAGHRGTSTWGSARKVRKRSRPEKTDPHSSALTDGRDIPHTKSGGRGNLNAPHIHAMSRAIPRDNLHSDALHS